MKARLTVLFTLMTLSSMFAQQQFYDVTMGEGNGVRFWQDNAYKIHMGNSTEYHFGDVTDYGVKMNMNNDSRRGWTWGVTGQVPVAAINTVGNMQIAGNFRMINNAVLEFGVGISKEENAGKIGYQRFSDALDIVGAGTANSNRKIKFWNEGGASFTGNVGIGVTSPELPLHIRSSTDAGMYIERSGADKYYIASQPGNFLQVGLSGGGASQSFVLKSGNVGIGTTSPDQKLTVNGTIHGKEVKVDLAVPAPDYVFEQEYKLLSLEEIKTYIDENKHLPDVPSAKEMEMNGVQLGEMNMLLLKKIEELTLHIIELEKRINLVEQK